MKRFLNWKWGLGLLGGLTLIGAAVFSLTTNRDGSQTSDFAQDDVVTAFIGDLSASATASGQVEARRRAQLSIQSSAVVEEILVAVGETVAAGDVLLRLDTADLALTVASATQTVRAKEAALAELQEPAEPFEIAAAQADFVSAQAAYDDLLAGPSATQIAISEASVTQANASLYSSSASLSDTRTAISTADLEGAKAAVVAAEFQLEQARDINERFANDQTDAALRAAEEAYAEAAARYNRLLAGVNNSDLAASQADVAAAAARVDRSRADLDALLVGPTAVDLATAQYSLAQAVAALDTLMAGPSETAIAIATAELTQAQLDLADAQARLDDATLVAPFDGVVTALNVALGEAATGAVVTIAALDSLEVVLNVDEADLSVLAIGQPAEITLETWPTFPIASEVIAIAPSANSSGSGIVSYDVHVGLGETDLPVKIGLTADAWLITEERPDVLLVPNAAIRADRQTAQYYVNLLQGTAVTEVEVTIGLRDRTNTQIINGLDAGDQLVIDYQIPNALDGSGPPGGPNN